MHRAIYDPARALRSAQDELGACDAVRAEVPRLRGLPGGGDPRIRAAAAYLLGWFPQEAAGSAPALRAVVAAKTIPGVAAKAIASAGLLGDTELIPRPGEYLSGSGPLLRWAAAIALARLGAADAEAIGALAAASVDPPHPGPGPAVGFPDGNLRGYAAQTLAMLDDHLPPSALNAVLEGLAQTSGVAAFPLATAVLRLIFPNGALHPLPPFGELTEPQQRVMRTLADLGPDTRRVGQLHVDPAGLEPAGRARRMPGLRRPRHAVVRLTWRRCCCARGLSSRMQAGLAPLIVR